MLLGTEWGVSMPLDARSQVLRLPRRVPSPERVKQCVELAQKDPAVVGHAPWIFAKEIVLLDALLAKEPSVEAEVQADPTGAGGSSVDARRGVLPVRTGPESGQPLPVHVSRSSWPMAASAMSRPRKPWASTAAATRRV